MRRFFMSALALLAILLPAMPAEAAGDAPRLAKAVILCRHGLRSPTQTPEELAAWSHRPWPEWNVAPGELTARGAELLRFQWTQFRQELARQGLLPASGKLKEGSLFLYADKNSRTRHSAEAILEVFAPEGGGEIRTHRGKGQDPLFHPVHSGLTPEPVFSAGERRALTQELELLCQREAKALSCLSRLLGPAVESPYSLHFPAEGTRRGVTLKGGLHTASSAAEVLLLQCLEWPVRTQSLGGDADGGRTNPSPIEEKTLQILRAPAPNSSLPPQAEQEPCPDAALDGPVMVSPRTALELLPVHASVQDILQRARPQALSSGLPLLAVMTSILAGTSPLPEANDAALTVFVGHDTNIANIAGLLDLHWQNGEFPADSTPPGSMLCLTLWESAQGKVVKASFLRQSLAAMLTTDAEIMQDAALYREALTLPGEDENGEGMALDAFADAVLTLTEGPEQN
ncbi:MAG: hypothetical protein IJE96_04720 [Mailhella sp.]|nr:hypothetical protein [Mailhella sp.]